MCVVMRRASLLFWCYSNLMESFSSDSAFACGVSMSVAFSYLFFRTTRIETKKQKRYLYLTSLTCNGTANEWLSFPIKCTPTTQTASTSEWTMRQLTKWRKNNREYCAQTQSLTSVAQRREKTAECWIIKMYLMEVNVMESINTLWHRRHRLSLFVGILVSVRTIYLPYDNSILTTLARSLSQFSMGRTDETHFMNFNFKWYSKQEASSTTEWRQQQRQPHRERDKKKQIEKSNTQQTSNAIRIDELKFVRRSRKK